jgi:hypothetical protein
MNLSELHSRLIAAARTHPPREDVPYAFEKRVMARLMARPPLDPWALWSRALWRAAASCIALTALLGIWSIASLSASDSAETFPDAFENSVFAAMPEHIEDSW